MLSIVGNEDRQKRFNEHIKSSVSHRRTGILKELLKLKNKAIINLIRGNLILKRITGV